MACVHCTSTKAQAENPVICTYMYVCMLEPLTVIDEERLSSFPYPHLPTRLHWVQNTETNALPNKSLLPIALTGSGPRGLSPAECTLLALALRALAGSSCSAGDQDKPLHGCPNSSARLGVHTMHTCSKTATFPSICALESITCTMNFSREEATNLTLPHPMSCPCSVINVKWTSTRCHSSFPPRWKLAVW